MSYLFETYDFSMFEARFLDHGQDHHFTREGLKTLFQLLEDQARDTGVPVEIDVTWLCCEFAEGNLEDVLTDYEVDTFEDFCGCTLAVLVDEDTVLYQVY